MAAISYDPRFSRQLQSGSVRGILKPANIKDEIEGLIRVYEDGRVERPPIIPTVPCTSSSSSSSEVTSRDAVIDKSSNLWARIYVPTMMNSNNKLLLPVVVYFHGGGFCVGSAAWSCYHNFLSSLAAKAGCVIFSINYRLAPEHHLPAAYDDGLKALAWITSEEISTNCWWSRRCNLSSGLFLAGDSSGANIAYNVATRLAATTTSSSKLHYHLKGLVLIQPFFGGETRTPSEKNTHDHHPIPPNSPLTLSASDTYWRLSLPFGATRDHPFSNPFANINGKLREPRLSVPVMVCISEMDILSDRSLDFCSAMNRGKKVAVVEMLVYRGVGHAFQILDRSSTAQIRTQEMVSHIKTFIHHQ